MKISSYCGSFTQRQFKKHIGECAVCYADAFARCDLDFNPEEVLDPTATAIDAEIGRLTTKLWDVLKPDGDELAQARVSLSDEGNSDPTDLEVARAVMDLRRKAIIA
jgi:hypothetical protein